MNCKDCKYHLVKIIPLPNVRCGPKEAKVALCIAEPTAVKRGSVSPVCRFFEKKKAVKK